MAYARILIDTNIALDLIVHRDPFYSKASLLLFVAGTKDLELWMGANQVTDALYIGSNKQSKNQLKEVQNRLLSLHDVVKFCDTTCFQVERMLLSDWQDPEDALVYETALNVRADAIVSRDKTGFENSILPVFDYDELFTWLKTKFNLRYDLTDFE